MTIAITGAAGFIGSRLAAALRADGARVRALDRERDVRDPAALRGAFDGATAVVHAAGLLRKGCEEDRAAGWATNVDGTLHVTREAACAEARVVFLSTGGVYDPPAWPADECAPVAPRDLYVASKLAGEAMVAAAALAAGATAVVLRLFTVYGPGPMSAARGHFLAAWLERAAAGQQLVVHGDGAHTIDATHVDDVVRGIRAALALPLPGGACRTFNLGSGVETRVADVAAWFRDLRGAESRTAPRPAGTPSRQLADLGRARAELGYAPSIAPRDGIRALLAPSA